MKPQLTRSGDPWWISTSIPATAALALGVLLSTVGQAPAQSLCLARDDLSRHLHEQFSEAPVANAIVNNGALLELYAKRDRSTWTLVMTRPRGTACVLVAGQDWNRFPWFWREQTVASPGRDETP